MARPLRWRVVGPDQAEVGNCSFGNVEVRNRATVANGPLEPDRIYCYGAFIVGADVGEAVGTLLRVNRGKIACRSGCPTWSL